MYGHNIDFLTARPYFMTTRLTNFTNSFLHISAPTAGQLPRPQEDLLRHLPPHLPRRRHLQRPRRGAGPSLHGRFDRFHKKVQQCGQMIRHPYRLIANWLYNCRLDEFRSEDRALRGHARHATALPVSVRGVGRDGLSVDRANLL